jgi:hypothetical protein
LARCTLIGHLSNLGGPSSTTVPTFEEQAAVRPNRGDYELLLQDAFLAVDLTALSNFDDVARPKLHCLDCCDVPDEQGVCDLRARHSDGVDRDVEPERARKILLPKT